MPIYEYRCEKCGAVSEILLLGGRDTPACKSCGSPELAKLMSAPNISMGGRSSAFNPPPGGCCGMPDSCGVRDSCATPGHCCGG